LKKKETKWKMVREKERRKANSPLRKKKKVPVPQGKNAESWLTAKGKGGKNRSPCSQAGKEGEYLVTYPCRQEKGPGKGMG